ncbi:hypothetical protein [Psychrobacter sp. FDAARGOS_221]|uniref:hypothetical protein n=1 Tax=Psychrobacter sp. FDAARGOS_221 TaxID=1975705 RepID=UPI000BB54E16|nr:hypothetical protein [Psychrobacter sp. FDAARGOS_221]PNK59556.1 hypothetical protein A6J60_000760 [Psychrobacter sp. FDAARGOS_221]
MKNHNTKPWCDVEDPLKKYYNLLNDQDLKKVVDITTRQNLKLPCFQKELIENALLLIDFSDYHNAFSQFQLFSDLIKQFRSQGSYLLWMPLNNDDLNNFSKFNPLMIAKTPFEVGFLTKASESMMQMLTGGFMVIDSKNQFISMIIDGYYMLSIVYDISLANIFQKYIDNWRVVRENLDETTATTLLTCQAEYG